MLNLILSFLVGNAPWLWIGISAAVAIFGFAFAKPFFLKHWPVVLLAAVVGYVALTMISDRKIINDLRADLSEQTLKAEQQQKSIDDYKGAIDDLKEKQKTIRKEVAKVRQGLDSKTIIKESENDPAQANSDLNQRWNALDSMFNEATGGERTAAPSGADPDPDATD